VIVLEKLILARQPLRLVGPIAIMIALAQGPSAHGQDHFSVLGEKEIQTRVAGKNITDAARWSMYLRPDGTLIGEESGERWTGVWKTQKNKLCLSSPSSKQLDCYEVWMSRENISLRMKNDGDGFDGIVEKHKGN
jgi:hypothetical protein